MTEYSASGDKWYYKKDKEGNFMFAKRLTIDETKGETIASWKEATDYERLRLLGGATEEEVEEERQYDFNMPENAFGDSDDEGFISIPDIPEGMPENTEEETPEAETNIEK